MRRSRPARRIQPASAKSSEPPSASRATPAAGFTLIELLTVIAIIAILAGITFGVVRGVKQNAAIAQTRAELAVLSQALADFKRQYGDYPQTPTPTTPAALYQALNGRIGPGGAAISPAGRRFVESGRFALNDPDPTHVDSADNYLLDPWGNAYRYVYYHRTAPDVRGCVLYSTGPDGVDGSMPSTVDGAYDQTAAGNADNIYANP